MSMYSSVTRNVNWRVLPPFPFVRNKTLTFQLTEGPGSAVSSPSRVWDEVSAKIEFDAVYP